MKTIWIVVIILGIIALLTIILLIYMCETSPTIEDKEMENDNNEFTDK